VSYDSQILANSADASVHYISY